MKSKFIQAFVVIEHSSYPFNFNEREGHKSINFYFFLHKRTVVAKRKISYDNNTNVTSFSHWEEKFPSWTRCGKIRDLTVTQHVFKERKKIYRSRDRLNDKKRPKHLNLKIKKRKKSNVRVGWSEYIKGWLALTITSSNYRVERIKEKRIAV